MTHEKSSSLVSCRSTRLLCTEWVLVLARDENGSDMDLYRSAGTAFSKALDLKRGRVLNLD